ncbi:MULTISPECIES: pca operon transcription factor PcaQ [unclassified Marinovum]
MDRRIKFRHLEAFIAIAAAKRLKTAAEHLNLTQPAISKTLKELEDILGVRLMARDRAGVRLTPEGKVFLQYSEQSAAALRQGLSSIAEMGEMGRAVLNVGALPSVSAQVLPQATALFRAMSPKTTLHINEGAHLYLTNQLRGGELDLVVGRLGEAATMEGIFFTTLFFEIVVAVVTPDHPLRGATRLDQISDQLIVYPSDTAAIRPLVARLMMSRGQPLFEDRIECVSGAFGRAMTLGPEKPVWFISRGVVADDLAAGRLVALDIDMGPTAGAVGIMVRSGERENAIQGLYREALIAAVRDMPLAQDGADHTRQP